MNVMKCKRMAGKELAGFWFQTFINLLPEFHNSAGVFQCWIVHFSVLVLADWIILWSKYLIKSPPPPPPLQSFQGFLRSFSQSYNTVNQVSVWNSILENLSSNFNKHRHRPRYRQTHTQMQRKGWATNSYLIPQKTEILSQVLVKHNAAQHW